MTSTAIPYVDAVYHPTTGCDPVSPGCRECWARVLIEGRLARFYPQGFKVSLYPERLAEPLTWSRRPRRAFVAPMGDLFHKDVPDRFIDAVFAVMAVAGMHRFRCRRRDCEHDGDCGTFTGRAPEPLHTFMVLTKRAERMQEYMGEPGRQERVVEAFGDTGWYWGDLPCDIEWPPPNVWVGVSAENQIEVAHRVDLLTRTVAAHRWLSLEPLLEPVSLLSALQICAGCLGNTVTPAHIDERGNCAQCHGQSKGWSPLEYVVVGGESGRRHRYCDPSWIGIVSEQCRIAGVRRFVKQASAYRPGQQGNIPPALWAVKELP